MIEIVLFGQAEGWGVNGVDLLLFLAGKLFIAAAIITFLILCFFGLKKITHPETKPDVRKKFPLHDTKDKEFSDLDSPRR